MRKMRWLALLALIALLGISCGESKETGVSADLVKLQGAGASFPAPLYSKWFKSYSGAHQNVQIDYQSVGSGSGVKSVIDKTVDFGASDAAMTPEEIAKVDVGVQCLPMTAGSIVLAYNVEGVSELKLPREDVRRNLPGQGQEVERSSHRSRRIPESSFPTISST